MEGRTQRIGIGKAGLRYRMAQKRKSGRIQSRDMTRMYEKHPVRGIPRGSTCLPLSVAPKRAPTDE
jgi:hypothetical protein